MESSVGMVRFFDHLMESSVGMVRFFDHLMESSVGMVRFKQSFEETALKPPSPTLLDCIGIHFAH